MPENGALRMNVLSGQAETFVAPSSSALLERLKGEFEPRVAELVGRSGLSATDAVLSEKETMVTVLTRSDRVPDGAAEVARTVLDCMQEAGAALGFDCQVL